MPVSASPFCIVWLRSSQPEIFFMFFKDFLHDGRTGSAECDALFDTGREADGLVDVFLEDRADGLVVSERKLVEGDAAV